jgi:archaellum component FlaG (FlaF/FlaG flagellin family)
MKSEKGITLTSLVIYVIGITIIFAVVANLTIYFNKNSRTIEYTTNNSAQITRLNQYLINDTKKENAQITEANENIIIIQANGETIKYTYDKNSKGIYRNKVKIANDVQSLEIKKDIIYDKTKLLLNITIGEQEQIQKDLEYII